MYRDLNRLSVRWMPYEGEGLEHLTLFRGSNGILARSVLIGESDSSPFGVSYEVECDFQWQVRAFNVRTTDGRSITMRAPRPGYWLDADGAHQPLFDGCIDIDLAGSPFTNTLPVRRLGLQPHDGTTELSMLYIPFDDFRPMRDGQRYTCLDTARRFFL